MSKLLLLCVRRPGLERAEYSRLLLAEHGPSVLARCADIESAAVNLVDEIRGCLTAYDSVFEISFAGQSQAESVSETLAPLVSECHVYEATEHVRRNALGERRAGRTGGVKVIYAIARKPGILRDEFVRRWTLGHTPRALRHHPTMHRYVQNVVERRLSAAGADWDGFALGYHASERDYRERMFDSEEGRKVIMEDVAGFIGASATLRVTEYVLR